MKNILLILLAFSLTSCVSFREKRKAKICATCPEIHQTDSVTIIQDRIIVKDTTVTIPADSAWYNAWIECKDGKPILHKEKSKEGKRARIDVTLSKDGELKAVANCDSLNYVITYYQHEIDRLNRITSNDTIKLPCKERPLNDLMYSIGAITSGIILLLFTFAFIRLASGKPILFNQSRSNQSQSDKPPSV